MDHEKDARITDEMSEKIIERAEELVTLYGAHTLTVRRILRDMSITNRVFYNRFHNIDEVLEIVYRNTAQKMRGALRREIDSTKDFFEYVTDLVVSSLLISYDTKMQFNQYVFESDSVSSSSYEWWTGEIRRLIDYAMERGYIRKVDSARLSYGIWCFCRGYNADAVGRNLPREEAVRNFRYSFAFLLEGLKRTDTVTE